MEQKNEMLDRFRAMLGPVDRGLAAARNRRLGQAVPAPAPEAPLPAPGSLAQSTGRLRFKAVRIQSTPESDATRD